MIDLRLGLKSNLKLLRRKLKEINILNSTTDDSMYCILCAYVLHSVKGLEKDSKFRTPAIDKSKAQKSQ